MLNRLIYDVAVWLDSQQLSTRLHESFYMYNWVETTQVLSLMLSLGMLFLIDLRILGLALTNVPASKVVRTLNLPMLVGFSIMVITGILLFYAIPVRTAQSLWFRIKVVLLIAAAVNAVLFHVRMNKSITSWDTNTRAPKNLRVGAAISLVIWVLVVICGRFIAYDWFDCVYEQSELVNVMAGCVAEQTQF